MIRSPAGQLPPGEPPVDQLPAPGEVVAVLQEILAGPEFATFEDPSVVRALIGWVLTKLGEFMAWLQQLVGEQSGVAAVLVALVVVLVLVAGWKIAARHAPRLVGAGAGEAEHPARGTPATAGEWLAVAQARASRGDLRPAATALYQGFLLTLDQRGVVSFHSSKTPGDYTLEIARGDGGTAGAAAIGGRFLDSFQDFSFGPGRPTPDGYTGLARLAREAGCTTEATDAAMSSAEQPPTEQPSR